MNGFYQKVLMRFSKVCGHLFSIAFILHLSACGGGGGSGTPLSPARNLVGTWKTAFPVTVNFNTDWCNSGTLSLVATQPWNITFVITTGQDDNHVNVEMDFTTGNFTNVGGCPDTGVVSEPSPMFLTGAVSSSNLVLTNGQGTNVANLNFTTDIMTGTYDYTYTLAYSQEEYTQPNGLTLTRQ